MNKLKLGIIGLGYWGPNFVRIARAYNQVNLVWCCDNSLRVLNNFAQKFPDLGIVSNYKNHLEAIDAAIVATPASTHKKIVAELLKAGKHVLVEKPLTDNLESAREMVKLAVAQKVVLMVDQIFLYNPAIRKLKEEISKNTLGKICYINAFYTAFGPVRLDTSVLFDLGPHWIYTICDFLESSPKTVFARGGNYLSKSSEDIVCLNLTFPKKIFVNLILSWIAPRKTRLIEVIGQKEMASIDDTATDQKLTIYDKSVQFEKNLSVIKHQIVYRDRGVDQPQLESKEPLKNVFEDFLDKVRVGTTPIDHLKKATETIKILETAQESLDSGTVVSL